MSRFAVRPGILGIAPYVGGESKVEGVQRVTKLSSNEGALGPSPKAIEAYKSAAENFHRYPDGNSADLRKTIATKHNIPENQIICTSGSDQVISLLCQAYAGPGDEVIHTRHAFLMYSISARAHGATPVPVPEINLTADIEAMAKAVTPKTKIVFLANPNNPTGSMVPWSALVALREKLPGDVLLVIDSAYAECVTDDNYTAGHELVKQYGDVIITRTFSKLYGLGGLRLGWGHGPEEVIGVLNRIRDPFNVSLPAQVAGIAALKDEAFLNKAIAHNTKWREWTADELTALGLKVYPSQGNFVLVSFGTAQRAEEARLYMKVKGILTRQMGAYDLGDCLRITIGTGEEMELVKATLTSYVLRYQ